MSTTFSRAAGPDLDDWDLSKTVAQISQRDTPIIHVTVSGVLP